MALIEKVCLFYRDGTSDKVYEIHLTQEEDGYRVTGYNGRRGTKLVAQPKTPRPVPYRTARYIFDNLEASKLNHRRTPYRVASRETPATENVTTSAADTMNRQGKKKEEEQQGYAARFLDAIEL
jgi:bifunctional non-homologous end joining protein LigD